MTRALTILPPRFDSAPVPALPACVVVNRRGARCRCPGCMASRACVGQRETTRPPVRAKRAGAANG